MTTAESKTVPTEVRYLNRMTPEAYALLDKKVRVVGSVPKTELEAGFLAGMEHVLRNLREGYVVG